MLQCTALEADLYIPATLLNLPGIKFVLCT